MSQYNTSAALRGLTLKAWCTFKDMHCINFNCSKSLLQKVKNSWQWFHSWETIVGFIVFLILLCYNTWTLYNPSFPVFEVVSVLITSDNQDSNVPFFLIRGRTQGSPHVNQSLLCAQCTFEMYCLIKAMKKRCLPLLIHKLLP